MLIVLLSPSHLTWHQNKLGIFVCSPMCPEHLEECQMCTAMKQTYVQTQAREFWQRLRSCQLPDAGSQSAVSMSRLPGPWCLQLYRKEVTLGDPQALFQALGFVAPTQQWPCGLSRVQGLQRQAPALARAHLPVCAHLESQTPKTIACAHLDGIN